jgi:hypothetical protein
VLKARFGNHSSGHWVAFQTTIVDVKVFSCLYGVKGGVSYFLSMCEKKTPAHEEVKYMSHFEDGFGNVVHIKAINQPEVHEYLPPIDKHNKQYHNLLNLEWCCWCTKDPLMLLFTTTLGIYVVDKHPASTGI